ncbi:MAG: RNA polymerase sigma factor [Actinomycetota bacterium]|nr:RNA polymerase sigma factor [Actinomycetota bacterium]
MWRRKDARSEGSVELVSPEVVARCRRGDEGAWKQLVEATQRDVYTLCLRILRDPDDAAEATQDTYLKAWRGLGGFRGDAMFTTWLYRVATNAAISKQRSRTRRRGRETSGHDVLEEVAAPGSIESAAEARLDLDVVEDKLSTLPEHYRTAVVLRDVYGLSIAEIADRMKISETAAKVRVHRARKMLKELVYGKQED